MSRVYWSLGSKVYDDYSNFEKIVTDYNQKISKDDHGWNPNELLTTKNTIKVIFEALWKNEDDYLEVTIHSEDGKGITMGKALFEITNQGFCMFENAGSSFFEGISYLKDHEDIPYYQLHRGT